MKNQGETSEQCVANAFFFHVLPKFTLFHQTRLFKDQLEFHYAVFYSYFVAFLSDTIRDSKQFKAFETLTQFLLWSIFLQINVFCFISTLTNRPTKQFFDWVSIK